MGKEGGFWSVGIQCFSYLSYTACCYRSVEMEGMKVLAASWWVRPAPCGCDSSGSLVAAVPRSSGWNGETQQRSWVTEARFQNTHIHIRAPWVLRPGWIHRGNAGETSSPSSSQWEHLPWLCLAKFLCRPEVWDGNIRERVEWMGIRSGKWGDFDVLQQSFLIFLSV